MKLKLLVLRCKNIEKSKVFYAALGMDFIKEKHGSGFAHYTTEFDSLTLELYPAQNKNTDNLRLGFEIKEFSTAKDIFNVVEEYEYNSKQIKVIIDPDGRKVEIYENQI